ncbi:MAG: hypothetical protein JSS55_06605 [Proteobacteria bacterium]|nr:hypothetical protein [Pseudomonadota bacterium]
MARRSTAEWGIRAALALVVSAIGYVSVTHSLANVIKKPDPERAHALAPQDGRITALLARKLFTPEARPVQRAKSARLAQLALRQDATAVPAVATLGIQAQLRGDTKMARRIFSYSQKLSRRDLESQLWAIEDAVGRSDIEGALRHYDITLRTSHKAPDLLYPVLGSAISDPAIRIALVKTLAGKPPWGPSFTNYVAANGADPRSVNDLFQKLRQAGIPVSEEATAISLKWLITRGFADEAWRSYTSAHPGADPRRSRDPQFAANIAYPSPFDWTPVNDDSVSTSIQRDVRGGIFDFAAPPSVGGTLLQQIQILPPGDYRIEGHSTGIDQPIASAPYWVLSCYDGRELGRVILPNSAQAKGVFTGRFSVPSGCPVQTLALVARPSDDVSGVAGQIDRIQLAPVQ